MLNASTKRYLLKPIKVTTYYHSMLWTPDSKRRVDIFRITTGFVNFSSLIFGKGYFSSLMLTLFLVCRRPRHLPPMRVQIFTPNLAPVNPALEKSPKGIC
jgi:hypothetical protein